MTEFRSRLTGICRRPGYGKTGLPPQKLWQAGIDKLQLTTCPNRGLGWNMFLPECQSMSSAFLQRGFIAETAIRVSERLVEGTHLTGHGKQTSSGTVFRQVANTVLWLARKVLLSKPR